MDVISLHRIQLSIFPTFVFLSLVWSSSYANSVHNCLGNHSEPSYPITSAIFTPNNTSFSLVLQAYINNLVSLLNAKFPQLGLKQFDCIETSWLGSVFFWTNINITTPVQILLDRQPRSLVNYLKRKSDYVQKPISKEGFEGIWKKMIELENVAFQFNPYGGKMAEISSTTTFPHRAGNLWEVQYQTNWNQEGKEVTDYYINLMRILYKYMTSFISKNPRAAFFNYRDIDLGINHNGENNYVEGRVYGVKYFKDNFERLVQIKTKS